jgi:hypothetical protein
MIKYKANIQKASADFLCIMTPLSEETETN